MSSARGRSLRRFVVLVVVCAIALQLYFLLRIACMAVVDPESTTTISSHHASESSASAIRADWFLQIMQPEIGKASGIAK